MLINADPYWSIQWSSAFHCTSVHKTAFPYIQDNHRPNKWHSMIKYVFWVSTLNWRWHAHPPLTYADQSWSIRINSDPVHSIALKCTHCTAPCTVPCTIPCPKVAPTHYLTGSRLLKVWTCSGHYAGPDRDQFGIPGPSVECTSQMLNIRGDNPNWVIASYLTSTTGVLCLIGQQPANPDRFKGVHMAEWKN